MILIWCTIKKCIENAVMSRTCLKEQSRPSVSKVTSADVSLTTPLNSATSLVNVMKSV